MKLWTTTRPGAIFRCIDNLVSNGRKIVSLNDTRVGSLRDALLPIH
jgi:hypothetical protein